MKRFLLTPPFAIRKTVSIADSLRLYQISGSRGWFARSHILESISSDLEFMESLLPRLPPGH